MKIETKATLNLEGFEALRKGLKPGQYVKVGVFGDHKSSRTDNTINNVELATIHEFGSISNHIPARSFIRMPIMEKRKEILAFAASRGMGDLLRAGDQKKALKILGVFAENIIQSAFDTGGFGKWQSLKHRVGKILVDTAQLRRAVWSKVVG